MSTEHAKKPTTIETATVEVAVSCRRAAWWGVGAVLMLAGVAIAGFAVGASSSPDSPFPHPPLPVPFAPPPPSADAPVLCSPAKYDANVLTGKVAVYRRGANLKPINEARNNEDLLRWCSVGSSTRLRAEPAPAHTWKRLPLRSKVVRIFRIVRLRVHPVRRECVCGGGDEHYDIIRP